VGLPASWQVWIDVERAAIRAEGLDLDDEVVAIAIDFVRWELSMLGG